MTKEDFAEELADKLKKLELNIQLEKRPYIKDKLRLEIKSIQNKIYKILEKDLEVKESECIKIKKDNSLIYQEKGILINKENSKFEIYAKEVYLENLVGCEIYANSEESIIITKCINCSLKCNAKQIRITNSDNIFLDAFTETGIFLEKSREIKIKNRKEDNNFCWNVKDFSNPFSSKNYKFV